MFSSEEYAGHSRYVLPMSCGRAGLKLYILYSSNVQTQVGATEARARFSELLGRVLFRGERVVITRNGRECAALISLEELKRLEAQAQVRGR